MPEYDTRLSICLTIDLFNLHVAVFRLPVFAGWCCTGWLRLSSSTAGLPCLALWA